MANGCTAEMDICLDGMAEATMRLSRIMQSCVRASMASWTGTMTRDQPQLQGGGDFDWTSFLYMSAVHTLHVHQLRPSRRSGDS
jgi:hypothetical protein